MHRLGEAAATCAMPAQWLIGVGLCLAGAAGTCLGMNMQKLSHLRNDALPPEQQKRYVAQKAWLAGFGVFTIGQLLNLASLSFATQSLLATLSSFALVCNVLFAPCLLKVGALVRLPCGIPCAHSSACLRCWRVTCCRNLSTGATELPPS